MVVRLASSIIYFHVEWLGRHADKTIHMNCHHWLGRQEAGREDNSHELSSLVGEAGGRQTRHFTPTVITGWGSGRQADKTVYTSHELSSLVVEAGGRQTRQFTLHTNCHHWLGK